MSPNKFYIICFIIIFSLSFSQEECDGLRYQQEIFQDSEIQVISNIQYGENVNTTFWGTEQNENLLLDVYLPTNDSQDSRPLIIFLYGGSFISGSKESPDIVELYCSSVRIFLINLDPLLVENSPIAPITTLT